jgi:hypothetical protein
MADRFAAAVVDLLREPGRREQEVAAGLTCVKETTTGARCWSGWRISSSIAGTRRDRSDGSPERQGTTDVSPAGPVHREQHWPVGSTMSDHALNSLDRRAEPCIAVSRPEQAAHLLSISTSRRRSR